MNEKWIALLGRRDQPTDAVEEYCRFLGVALRERGIELQLERVAWDEAGWAEARRGLRKRAAGWRGNWVFVQYTALAWSARGFPLRVPGVVKILKESGAQVAVVYHDVEPYEGGRFIDKVRRLTQVRTMRRVMRLADRVILTVPAEKISWLPADATRRAMFIPVGANLPSAGMSKEAERFGSGRTVAVFGVTGGKAGLPELQEIAGAMRIAASAMPGLRLVVLGRNSEAAETTLRDLLKDTGVQIRVLGMRPGEEVVHVLSQSDALLFVRSPISSRRSSAIAGIACGLPVIARTGSETAAPVTEAGIAFYTQGEKDEPGATLTRVLEDESYRALLAERSRRAYEEHFSWNAIAGKFARAFTQPE
jgi:glycosyltransferase involved in cell wall biosynthesis